jgi:hypothetical protein
MNNPNKQDQDQPTHMNESGIINISPTLHNLRPQTMARIMSGTTAAACQISWLSLCRTSFEHS